MVQHGYRDAQGQFQMDIVPTGRMVFTAQTTQIWHTAKVTYVMARVLV